jgi:hypothetical protein
MNDYVPLTRLEALVRDAMAGIGSEREVLAELVTTKLWVPSTTDVHSEGDEMTPLILQSKRYNAPMIVTSDDVRHIGAEVSGKARFSLEMDGAWLVKSLAPGHGLMLFVGPTMGCEFSAEQLAEQRGTLAGPA